MADRSSEESLPDRTGARSASSRSRGTGTSTSSAASPPAKTAPARTNQRRTAQSRTTQAKPAGATSAARPAPVEEADQAAAQAGGPSAPAKEAPPLTDRINAAYASSGPVLPDDAPSDSSSDRGASRGTGADPGTSAAKTSGAERFAAAMAGSKAEKTTQRPWEKPRRVRKARLRVTHVDPWSVMKTAFLLSVAIGIVTVVAVAVVWLVLDAAGVWSSIDKAVGDVVGDSSSTFRIEDYIGLSRVLGFSLIVSVVDVVLITVIATLGAFLYNLAAALLGGVEVVLAEEDH